MRNSFARMSTAATTSLRSARTSEANSRWHLRRRNVFSRFAYRQAGGSLHRRQSLARVGQTRNRRPSPTEIHSAGQYEGYAGSVVCTYAGTGPDLDSVSRSCHRFPRPQRPSYAGLIVRAASPERVQELYSKTMPRNSSSTGGIYSLRAVRPD